MVNHSLQIYDPRDDWDDGQLMHLLLSDKIGGERQNLIDWITSYLYIENFPILATSLNCTDFEQQPTTSLLPNVWELWSVCVLQGDNCLLPCRSRTCDEFCSGVRITRLYSNRWHLPEGGGDLHPSSGPGCSNRISEQ